MKKREGSESEIAATPKQFTELMRGVGIADPKVLGREIVESLKYNGSSQMHSLSQTHLFAKYVAAYTNSVYLSIESYGIGEEPEDDMIKIKPGSREYSFLKANVDLYDTWTQLQRKNSNENALQTWVGVGATTRVFGFVEGHPNLLGYFRGMEEVEVEFMRVQNAELLVKYFELLPNFGEESDRALKWIDSFNNELYKGLFVDFAVKTGLTTEEDYDSKIGVESFKDALEMALDRI